MSSNFFAMISRMKYIDRWSLMRNEHPENLSEHSFEVAVLSHALAVIGNKRFGKSHDPERAALLGLYHDAPETLTGDLPTPVKYYSDEVRKAYGTVESFACESLLSMLPEDIRDEYISFFVPREEDGELWKLVKAADKLSALIKCIQEQRSGSREFDTAAESTEKSIEALHLPEAEVFLKEMLPAYSLTLDELKE